MQGITLTQITVQSVLRRPKASRADATAETRPALKDIEMSEICASVRKDSLATILICTRVTGMTQQATAGDDARVFRSRGRRLTTKPPRKWRSWNLPVHCRMKLLNSREDRDHDTQGTRGWRLKTLVVLAGRHCFDLPRTKTAKRLFKLYH